MLLLAVIFTTVGFAQKNISNEEKLALVALYEQTNGDDWKNSWNLEESVTTWQGVKLKEGKVVAINLFNNNLVGVLPIPE